MKPTNTTLTSRWLMTLMKNIEARVYFVCVSYLLDSVLSQEAASVSSQPAHSLAGRSRSPSLSGRSRSLSLSGRSRSPSVPGSSRSPSVPGRSRSYSLSDRSTSMSVSDSTRSRSSSQSDSHRTRSRSHSPSGSQSNTQLPEEPWLSQEQTSDAHDVQLSLSKRTTADTTEGVPSAKRRKLQRFSEIPAAERCVNSMICSHQCTQAAEGRVIELSDVMVDLWFASAKRERANFWNFFEIFLYSTVFDQFSSFLHGWTRTFVWAGHGHWLKWMSSNAVPGALLGADLLGLRLSAAFQTT